MIRFENVTKRYRGTSQPALDDVDFEIERGEFVFLVGASGSGKSSCLRLMLREGTPTSGRVLVLGRDTRRLTDRRTPYFRRNIGSVFQDFRLLPSKTVTQNIAFALQVIGRSRALIKSAVPEALERVGLEGMGKRMPHELSGGEQQRVAIARAIVNRPQIVLADEPTGNLDPTTSVEIMRLLEGIHAAGTTVVMATHEAGFVDKMQRRVIELSDGVLLRDEQRGSYGDTSVVSTLKPETDKGASSIAALTAALDVQREVAGSEPGPDRVVSKPEDAAPERAVVPDAVVSAEPATETREPESAAGEPPADEQPVEAEGETERTSSIPQVDVDVEALGMADRLGLKGEDDDEVGPTS
ncbi:cell division ATP-binding protein FtsE [Microbacterium sp. G2-8]|uniref:cell division ATP-binding protein FtsE n=1 Tax=Microbacterium sp. G2-8 TaxID=2842454 RepID=UPI001C894467|nr:cell division ATP-binding protein FtsE [Microbacterium sp. G2-8]